eukprot:1158527-Pelagomonas_calceolata.AAC.8
MSFSTTTLQAMGRQTYNYSDTSQTQLRPAGMSTKHEDTVSAPAIAFNKGCPLSLRWLALTFQRLLRRLQANQTCTTMQNAAALKIYCLHADTVLNGDV